MTDTWGVPNTNTRSITLSHPTRKVINLNTGHATSPKQNGNHRWEPAPGVPVLRAGRDPFAWGDDRHYNRVIHHKCLVAAACHTTPSRRWRTLSTLNGGGSAGLATTLHSRGSLGLPVFPAREPAPAQRRDR